MLIGLHATFVAFETVVLLDCVLFDYLLFATPRRAKLTRRTGGENYFTTHLIFPSGADFLVKNVRQIGILLMNYSTTLITRSERRYKQFTLLLVSLLGIFFSGNLMDTNPFI